ncbi:MAG: amidohydrolase family protein [Acidimicrobiales bacterium]
MVTTGSARLRAKLQHPVIDGDGHYVDLRQPFHAYVRDHGAGELLEAYNPFAGAPMSAFGKPWGQQTTEERHFTRNPAPPFWVPPGDTDYFATVTIPKMYYERLDEAGIDFSVLYPTVSFGLMHNDDETARRGLCHWFNEWAAEQYRPYSDRMTVAGLIPMHTPEEAIAELDHIRTLGLKVGCIASFVARPVPQFADASPEIRHRIRFIDAYGIDSPHDYDPFWQRAVDLKVPLACHSPSMGFSDRASSSNYMFNHCGHFAASGDLLARSLFFGGVTKRFPDLRIALLEGGVAVGVRLYGDLVARWKKRGGPNMARLNPDNIDRARYAELIATYGSDLARFAPDELASSLGTGRDAERDDYARSGVRSAEDIRDQFCTNFYWGCEADDPLVALAFDPRVNPLGARVPAIMGSDIGHWDVPDFTEPLEEAWELVEHGLLDEEQFRDFVFTNQVKLYGVDPEFFRGTVIESAAAAVGR